VSAGGFNAGSRQILFNDDPRWTGSYTGVAGIRLQMANFGSTPLSMRMAVSNLPGTAGTTNAYASSKAYNVKLSDLQSKKRQKGRPTAPGTWPSLV
jgi:hypothetical protein